MLKGCLSACAFAVLATTLSGTAHAQGPADYRTFFTFSQPVTLPGVTLPAGTYLFRLADPTGSRRVVQILSEDAQRSYAMLLAIPAQRFDPPVEPEIRFMETAADRPAAIKTWWYPGNSIGWEFIYPREQALRLAKAAAQPVLTTAGTPNATTDEMKTVDLSRVSASGEQSAVTAEPTPAATAPTGGSQHGQVASSTVTIPSTPTPVSIAGDASSQTSRTPTSQSATPPPSTTRTTLPRTASPLPIVALVGALAFCAGLSLWLWPRLRV